MSFLRRLGPVPPLFLGYWLLLLIGGRSRLLRDPGTFWHTVTGDRILRDGFFTGDPYTFSHAGARWVPHQWLGEVGMSIVHGVAGLDGLLLLTAAALAAVFAWLTARLLTTGLHPVIAVPVGLLAVAASGSNFHVRPLVFTIAATAGLVVALTECDAGRLSVRRLWWLVPLFVVWTNTHGGMLGGLGTLLIAGLGWAAAKAIGRPTPFASWADAGRFAAIVLACGLTAVVNPYGWETPRAWLVIMTGPKIPQVIEEHRPLDPTEPFAWPLFGFAAVYLVALASVPRPAVRVSWLLPLVWFAQSFLRVRHAPLFAVSGLAALAVAWPASRLASHLARTRPDLHDPSAVVRSPAWGWLIPVGVVATCLGLQSAGVRVPVFGAGWATVDPDRWPVELTDTLREHEPRPGEPNRLFNECEFGGYVIYHAAGYRLFVDDRAELFGDAWLDAFVRAGAGDPSAAVAGWQAAHGRFDYALTRTGTGFDAYFHAAPGWTAVRQTATANFYRRSAR